VTQNSCNKNLEIINFVTNRSDGEESCEENDDRQIDNKGLKPLHCAVQYDLYFGTNCAEQHLIPMPIS